MVKILGIVLLIIIGISGFLVWKNNFEWKTYKNSRYNFTLQYPEKFFTITEPDVNLCPKSTLGCKTIPNKGDVVEIKYKLGSTYITSINFDVKNMAYLESINSSEIPKEIEQTKIGSATMYFLIYKPTNDRYKITAVSDYSIKGSRLHSSFQWYYKNLTAEIVSEELPEGVAGDTVKILSTFKFL